MKIKEIKISNFHCYKESVFHFTNQTTVLIGKNGSGKSSMINAIKNALSVFFYSNQDWGYSPISGSVPDLGVAKVSSDEIWHDRLMKPADIMDISVSANDGEHMMPQWAFRKKSKDKSQPLPSYFKEAYCAFMNHFNETQVLPLFACYSDSYPHKESILNSTTKHVIDNDDMLYRGWGYFHWDFDESSTNIWQKRFMRVFNQRTDYERMLSEETEANNESAKLYRSGIEACNSEINYILKYLRIFTVGKHALLSDTSQELEISNLNVMGVSDSPYIVVYFTDGKRKKWTELPAGYERILNIVFDISYRSYILNGKDTEPNGIVFIDEIDLHLHPTLEQDVLQRFRIAFPNLQLIVSTHSPLVISNFQQNQYNSIIQMECVDGIYQHHNVPDLYGMDYNLTLSSIMNTAPRNVYVQILKEKYLRLLNRGKEEKAQETLAELQTMLSPEIFEKIKNELSSEFEK